MRKLVIIAAIGAVVFATGADNGCSETGSDKATDNWGKVHAGMARYDVEQLLGEPDDEQSFESEGSSTGCVYYGTSHQVCYDGPGLQANVESKNSY